MSAHGAPVSVGTPSSPSGANGTSTSSSPMSGSAAGALMTPVKAPSSSENTIEE